MTEHEHFDKEDFRVRTAARSYEDCLFTGCLFSSADLRDCEFTCLLYTSDAADD